MIFLPLANPNALAPFGLTRLTEATLNCLLLRLYRLNPEKKKRKRRSLAIGTPTTCVVTIT